MHLDITLVAAGQAKWVPLGQHDTKQSMGTTCCPFELFEKSLNPQHDAITP